jgi:tetratricopeptide (TPR) repeat protein
MEAMTSISAKADALHEEGRKAGSAGDPVRALQLFHQAHQLEPDWPYPPYDMAFTYLLNDYLEQAEQWYELVDKLAPRGFFTSKTTLDLVRRERRGEFPPGFTKAFVAVEWEPEDRQRHLLQQIVTQYPRCAPAWQRLAFLTKDEGARLEIIDRGLAASPDDETYGVLISNKALILIRQGDPAEGQRLLRALVADKRCTAGVEAVAKMSLAGDPKTGPAN